MPPQKRRKIVIFKVNLHDLVHTFCLRRPHKVRRSISAKNRGGACAACAPSKSAPGCYVTVPLEDMGRVPQHIRGEKCSLDVGKFVRETARQLKTDTGTICRWRWRDRFRSTCEVKDRPCVGRPRVTSETSGSVYGILKLQLF